MYWMYVGPPDAMQRPLIGSDTVEEQWTKLHPRQKGTFESFRDRIEAGEVIRFHAATLWKGELNPVIGTDEFKQKELDAIRNQFEHS